MTAPASGTTTELGDRAAATRGYNECGWPTYDMHAKESAFMANRGLPYSPEAGMDECRDGCGCMMCGWDVKGLEYECKMCGSG